MNVDSHLPQSAARLKQARAALWERALAGSVGGFAWEYTHLVDRYFEDRLGEVGEQSFPFTLVAVGGYGRGRLCPGSDVDILLVFKRRIPRAAEEFVKAMLYPLWDIGLDLGHGVRTVPDCISLARKDFQVLASLLDARPLAGDASVFAAFREQFDTKVLRRKGGMFIESLREHNEARANQYGDASGLLEPELKNGLGGLRDGQQVFWLHRVIEAGGESSMFLPEELARLREDQAFVNRVRTALHLAAGRKNDRLHFDLQPPTARLMGFVCEETTPEAAGRGVEFFLSRLHQAMTRIKAMRAALFQERFARASGPLPELSVPNLGAGPDGLYFRDQAAMTPDSVLGAFLESARSGLPLTWGARRLVRFNPGRFASGLIDRPETVAALVDIFMAPHGDVACDGLVETRLLPAMFPEFGDVEHLIQFNDYHVHPVGRHTIQTVTQLSRFVRDGEGWIGEISARIPHPGRLVLAGFFHDLGKGEPDHSRSGASMAREVLTRFGLESDVVDDVAFLVERHLLIPKAATRRDLSDERVASEVAGAVSSPERLDMLYLLSVADSMATGPRAWNSWTRSLFAELYFKVRNLLEQGPLAEADATRRIVAIRDQVRKVSGHMDVVFVEAALDAMPPRAFLALSATTLVEHMALVRRLWEQVAEDRMRKPSTIGGKGVNLVEAAPGSVEGTYVLTIAAIDRTGLFATMAGAMALHGLNILAADLFTWKDGTAVDVFTVSSLPGNLYVEEVWARVSRSIGYALTGKLDIPGRLEERRNSPLHRKRTGPRLKPIVTIDNRASDFYTVVEVAVTDRMGILHDIARTLAECGVSIHLAQITTIKGRAADIFHVRDEHGQKLAGEKRMESIRTALLDVVSF